MIVNYFYILNGQKINECVDIDGVYHRSDVIDDLVEKLNIQNVTPARDRGGVRNTSDETSECALRQYGVSTIEVEKLDGIDTKLIVY
ncbi:hypothetical protein MJO48_09745 [Dickeya fangzhongdai]|uniref:Uncharacterized protein n=1 Tax=Dickeya dadantii (strain 3937) TaxID=198628 RepID=E0SCS9_DICD3|nr:MULTISPECIES: hypothetical protein [Dickeya]ADM99720.1 hypothetical protein Dda3937_00951 [Dickeya dadantii 3937]ULR32924.1 hypothetical protein MJO48_09745 [Dickeya fangzhongdai]